MSATSKTPAKPTVKFSVGQAIRLADHDPVTGPDAKPVPFYDFYRNLAGTVAKVFDDGTVSVTVDRNSLPKELRQRHEDCEHDRDKWLDKLSDEERNRLSAAQKKFSYRYTLLVAAADVLPAGSVPAPPVGAKPASEPSQRSGKAETIAIDVEPRAVPRRSSEELAHAEERYLQEIQNRNKDS